MKISVALCTFNGVRHLEEQLNSYIDQTRRPDEVVVCDDGSNDGTWELINAFGRRAPFPVEIHKNERNLGYNENFLRCASLCCGDIIAFSDQDDVWLPAKLATGLKFFLDESVTAVVHPLLCTDENLMPTGLVIPPMGRIGKLHHPEQEIFFSVNGMAIMFRTANVKPFLMRTRTLSKWGQGFAPFDEWVLFLASIQGMTAHLRKPLSYYRRHSSAVTGDPHHTFNPAFQFQLARNAGSQAYGHLADVATSRRKFAEQLMNHVSSAARKELSKIPAFYSRIESLYRQRADLYTGRVKSAQVRTYLRLLASGGYRSRHAGGLGWKALAKDLYLVSIK